VSANACRLKLRPEVCDHLRGDLADGHRAECRLDVLDEHPLVADAGPLSQVGNGVLRPPLPRQVSQRSSALFVKRQLAHGSPYLEVRGEGLDLLLAVPWGKVFCLLWEPRPERYQRTL
jgi:hypothetical protein